MVSGEEDAPIGIEPFVNHSTFLYILPSTYILGIRIFEYHGGKMEKPDIFHLPLNFLHLFNLPRNPDRITIGIPGDCLGHIGDNHFMFLYYSLNFFHGFSFSHKRGLFS